MGKDKNFITIGKAGSQPFNLDVKRLITSRALITASSGGGKSWLLRKMLEELSATTQTIVIDPEGEFSSLREIRDMLLVGGDGDLPADPLSAALLCRRLMELNVSAVLDIFELTPSARRQFVANFLTEMVNLPKSLWRNCIVAIDEAHEFAPSSNDKSNVSREPVGLLFSKGRKRGYCPLIATQRFGKLSMDVAAEARNRFIGLQNQDVDWKRAADALGWDKSKWMLLRDLSPPGQEGEFFAVGPALADRGVVKFRAGKVRSTHPSAGDGTIPEPPRPSKHIAGVLSELKDLPQQAAEEIRGLASAKKKISELELELKAAHVAAAKPTVAGHKTTAKPDPLTAQTIAQQTRTIARLRKGLEDAMTLIALVADQEFEAAGIDPDTIKRAVEVATTQIVKAAAAKAVQQQAQFAKLKKQMSASLASMQKILGDTAAATDRPESRPTPLPPTNEGGDDENGETLPAEGLSKSEQKILNTIAALNARGIAINGADRLARWLSVHRKNGQFGADLGRLRRDSYLDKFDLTSLGAGVAIASRTGYDGASRALPDEGKKSLLRQIHQVGRKLSSTTELAELLGVHRKNGQLGSNLGWLRSMGLITTKGIEPTPELYK